MAKITICGSMTFYRQMNNLADKLRKMGFEVYSPQIGEDANFPVMHDEEIMRVKGGYMQLHLKNINESDAVLIANYKKNEMDNYIGPSTLIELGVAFAYRKKIFLLFDMPTDGKKVEFLGLRAVPLKGNIEQIKEVLEKEFAR